MQLCTFKLGDYFFGVDVEKVQEVIRHQEMTRIPLAKKEIRGLINLRGQIVTAVDLRLLLGLSKFSDSDEPMNIIICDDDGAVSFQVDEIGDVLDVDESSFEYPPETLKGIARELIQGAYKLTDRLLLVLDADKAVEVTA
ncbi:CheW protein [Mariprofundus ferrinatatus]|uniref:CheW protein n=1 Tax=Mariprofundus ferrinatatus TaxID=1921087 RepID=A0A2K8LDA7_9PROT|nr:chemotaxis protein CheW [Mariprofundus ferrinatatus]ATX82884.1 CheW protein [Mariprofundus ferrinatatus]